MGDRAYTTIQFSGTISRELAEELVRELEGQACRCDDPDTDKLEIKLLMTSSFYDSDCNYATMEGVENFCREHGVPYCKTWVAGDSYGPGMTVFTGSEAHDCGTLDDEPVVTRSQLLKLGTGILEYFDRFDFTPPRYPPLVIEGVDVEQEAA
jgi:hypothetical protein